jgi:cobalt-zinc-cadmium efflux system membrane fusion protein
MLKPTSALLLASTLLVAGCGQTTTEQPAAETTPAAATAGSGHAHSGWWCNEHGVPEEVCGLCDSKLAAEFQRNGDWCREHERPDSQCFACHPELEAQFAAQYEAKEGKKPPKPEG